MLKIRNLLKRCNLVLSCILSFLIGAVLTATFSDDFISKIKSTKDTLPKIISLKYLALNADEPVSTALPIDLQDEASFKEDPLNIHFELVNIEAEKKVELTDEVTDQVLSDFQNRISPEFAVPEIIFNQTKFWFKVYTEFDSNKKIIHDSLHPHIIYDIVDVSEIMALPTRAAWLNVEKAQKIVSKRVSEIRTKLKKMSKKNEKDMDAEELGWLASFKEIKGSQKKIILRASQNLRVQTGQKDFFEKGLLVSGRYLSGIEEIFRSHKLPTELARLPFVESSFVIGATSKVGAAGIWQFMPGIGRKFMVINDQFDERRNPWKASEAAAKLLKENHMILYKNWGLALTAYNHGPGGVKAAMKKIGTRDIGKIVRNYRSRNFDFASANFYTCFLAAVHAQIYRDVIWTDRTTESPLLYSTTRLKKSMKPAEMVKAIGFTYQEILLYNPELDRSFKKNSIIPKGYRLFLPASSKLASVESQNAQ